MNRDDDMVLDERMRRLEGPLRQALSAFRAVVVTGPRQAGKTTLVHKVVGDAGTFVRLDRQPTLQAVLADPMAAATQGTPPRAFDEVQRGGDPLIRAIKVVLDDNRDPGQFLLNGSADFLTTPILTESLAGRAVFLELWPFTQGEIEGHPDRFLERAFNNAEQLLSAGLSPESPGDYLTRICRGGFPEVIALLRDRDGGEIDLIAEAADGRVVAVEVKAAQAVSPRDAHRLKWLRAISAGGDITPERTASVKNASARMGLRL